MKQNKYGTWAVGAFMLLLSAAACTDSYESTPVDMFTEDYLFSKTDSNGTVVRKYLNRIYYYMRNGHNGVNGDYLDAASDDALSVISSESDVYKLAIGRYSASNFINSDMIWSDPYLVIRRVNILLSGIDVVPFNTTYTDALGNTRRLNDSMKAEARFLRAYFYFELVKRYGGVPIIGDKVYELNENIELPRSTFEQCIKYIVSELDDIKDDLRSLPLPDAAASAHVVNTQAAQALKIRVLLYAASPAYQDKDVIQINGMGNFTVLNEATYQAGWERAALFANEVLKDAGINYTFTAMAAKDLADAGSDTPADFIFRTYMGLVHGMESRHYPPFYLGNAQTIPSHNLAAAFPAKNGYPITDSRSLYDEQDPYLIARDNRFNMNLYYQGKKFGAYNSNIDVSEGGKDSESFHIYASRSGYYLSKFLSTTQKNMLDPIQTLNSRHFNPLLRKTEVWLNYAEAANEAWGPESKGDDCKYSAYDVLKIIREKSGGITDATYLSEVASEGKDAFRKLIQNERRIEFAFEDHRFWDLRRCLLPLDTTIEGIQVTRTDNGLSYEIKEIEQRPLDALRYYYLPLPNDELLKNPNLKNNMGWNNN